MRILLIEPAKAHVTLAGEDIFIFESLALEYIAAGISEDHEVRILDMRLDKRLQETLNDFHPDIVGITSYTVHVNTVRKLFEEVKGWNRDVLTVVGGHHATVVPEDLLSPSIDLIVMGEGVFTFREIVARLEKGEGFRGIPGTAYADNDVLVKTDGHTVIDLDSLPFPDRKITAEYRKEYYSEWMKPLASIRTSKGCPFRCNFCALWKLTDGKYLRRKPEKIVEELAEIEEDFVFFADDESLVDVPRMKRLAQLIGESGIKKRYFVYGRSDTVAQNADLLEMWRSVGLERVFVGLEFFRDEDLLYVKKGSTADDNRQAVKVLHDLDIGVYASFIIRPDFGGEDFATFRRYCHALNVDFASFAMLTPLPGTDFYAEVKDQLLTNDYDYFDFLHTVLPTSLPLKEFYKEYHNLVMNSIPTGKRFSLLRKFPLKDLPALFVKSFRLYGRLKNAYKDYEE
jgi:radical SAM superfamily enzyme YgiQ (UPF0313 family)